MAILFNLLLLYLFDALSVKYIIGTASPNTVLDVNGALSVRAITAPTISPATQGRIYFDSAANKFKISENGGAYQDLVGGAAGGGGWTDDGTVVRLAAVADKVGIGTAGPASALHVNAQTGQYANDGSKPTMLLSYTGATYANHYIGATAGIILLTTRITQLQTEAFTFDPVYKCYDGDVSGYAKEPNINPIHFYGSCAQL